MIEMECEMDEENPYHTPKRSIRKSECQDKIDLLLVDALSKSDGHITVSEQAKSSNHLYCDSIVEILPPKKSNGQD